MTLADILQDLKFHRAETAREVTALDAAIEAIEQNLSPERRTVAAKLAKAEAKPELKRRVVTGPKPARSVAEKCAAKAAAGLKTPESKTAPVAHVGRIHFARNVTRVDFADRDKAIGEARRLADRGYQRQRDRPLKPGGFDLLTVNNGFTLVFVERASDDTHSALEAAA